MTKEEYERYCKFNLEEKKEWLEKELVEVEREKAEIPAISKGWFYKITSKSLNCIFYGRLGNYEVFPLDRKILITGKFFMLLPHENCVTVESIRKFYLSFDDAKNGLEEMLLDSLSSDLLNVINKQLEIEY